MVQTIFPKENEDRGNEDRKRWVPCPRPQSYRERELAQLHQLSPECMTYSHCLLLRHANSHKRHAEKETPRSEQELLHQNKLNMYPDASRSENIHRTPWVRTWHTGPLACLLWVSPHGTAKTGKRHPVSQIRKARSERPRYLEHKTSSRRILVTNPGASGFMLRAQGLTQLFYLSVSRTGESISSHKMIG